MYNFKAVFEYSASKSERCQNYRDETNVNPIDLFGFLKKYRTQLMEVSSLGNFSVL